MSPHRFVFVGGLHGSGTSLVHRLLRSHPQVSGFSGTGVWQDEGQHLQDVIPTARSLGGPGRFGWRPEAHLTEGWPVLGAGSRARLLHCWEPHWDLDRPVLVEKSPPNLLRFRLLRALFPSSACVAVIRHPLAVALSTRHMRRLNRLQRTGSLVRHWLHCHDLFEADRSHLPGLHLVRYQDLVAHPDSTWRRLQVALELEPIPLPEPVRSDPDRRWERLWRSWRYPELLRRPLLELEEETLRHGYSLAGFGR